MLPCPEAARPFSPYIRYNLPWSVPVYHLLMQNTSSVEVNHQFRCGNSPYRQICNLPEYRQTTGLQIRRNGLQKSSIKKKKVIKKENCGVMPLYEAKNFRCPELLFSFAGKKP